MIIKVWSSLVVDAKTIEHSHRCANEESKSSVSHSLFHPHTLQIKIGHMSLNS